MEFWALAQALLYKHLVHPSNLAEAPLLVQLPQPDPFPLGKELMASHPQPQPRKNRRRQMAHSSPRLQGEK